MTKHKHANKGKTLPAAEPTQNDEHPNTTLNDLGDRPRTEGSTDAEAVPSRTENPPTDEPHTEWLKDAEKSKEKLERLKTTQEKATSVDADGDDTVKSNITGRPVADDGSLSAGDVKTSDTTYVPTEGSTDQVLKSGTSQLSEARGEAAQAPLSQVFQNANGPVDVNANNRRDALDEKRLREVNPLLSGSLISPTTITRASSDHPVNFAIWCASNYIKPHIARRLVADGVFPRIVKIGGEDHLEAEPTADATSHAQAKSSMVYE